MNFLKKAIRGLLIASFAFGLFTLNAQPVLQSKAMAPSATDIAMKETSLADLFAPQSFAANGEDAPEDEPPRPPKPEVGEEAEDKADEPLDIKKLLETVAKASTYVNNIFNPLIHFLTFNIGNFLSNDYIFGGGMGDMLHGIWVVSRNIVNIIFVLILLFLAVRHIFGGEENTDLKKTLPKFVIMLIAINFSWLAGKIILDAANVATNVVFQIPAGVRGVIGEEMSNKILFTDEKGENISCTWDNDYNPKGPCQPSNFYYPGDTKKVNNYFNCNKDDLKNLKEGYETAYPSKEPKENPPGYITGYSKTASICWQQMDLGKYDQNTASYFLSFSMARVQNLTRATTGGEIGQLAIGTLFALIIQIVYLVAFASLYIALIIRVAALWFLMAFSPFLVLIFYLTKDLQMPGGGMEDQVSISAFISWAFAPAKVGAVFSVGFLMVTAGQGATSKLFETLNAKGQISSSVFSVNSLFLGMDSIQQFIWLLMTTGIIWVGTFAVLTKLKVGGQIFQRINQYGTDLAREVAKSPKWAPIMPVYDHEHKKWGLGSYAKVPGLLGALRAAKTRAGGISGIDRLHDTSQKLKETTHQNALQAALKANNPEQAYKAFMGGATSGFNHQDLIDTNKTDLKKALQASGINEGESEKLTDLIKKGAKGTKPEDLSVKPPREAAPSLTGKEMEEAFRNAMRQEKINIGNWREAEVFAKAKEIKAKPENANLSDGEALRKALEELGKAPPPAPIKPEPSAEAEPPEK